MDDKKSTTGYIFIMERGVVSCWSAKQFVIASSTVEAEYVACYEATRHAVWLWNFIHDLGVVDSIEKPIMMYCDNTVAVSFSNNLKRTLGARYINVKYFVVRKKVEEGLITVVHTLTYSMVVDPLTKALPISIFEEHVSLMGLLGSSDYCGSVGVYYVFYSNIHVEYYYLFLCVFLKH